MIVVRSAPVCALWHIRRSAQGRHGKSAHAQALFTAGPVRLIFVPGHQYHRISVLANTPSTP